MLTDGEMEQDYRRIIYANNVSINSLHELVDNSTPLKVGSLIMYPLTEIETFDGNYAIKPIKSRESTFFHRGEIDCHGTFYDREGEEQFVRQLVATIPSGFERLMTRILTGGEESADRCRVSLIRIPNNEDISMTARFTNKDISDLGRLGIGF